MVAQKHPPVKQKSIYAPAGGGRTDVRKALYMPTLVAIQHNPVIRRFYQRLIEKGKAKMAAVVACMRKLLLILNVLLKTEQYWQPKTA